MQIGNYFLFEQYPISREGQTCHYIYFVKKGLLKLFSIHNDREFIMRFFLENSFVTVFDSFTYNKASRFQLMALEDCELSLLHRDKYEALCKSDHQIETFFRKLIQHTAAKMHERITEILENDATAHYQLFLEGNRQLIQRVSLGDLANYLGITQSSLSKIRAKK